MDSRTHAYTPAGPSSTVKRQQTRARAVGRRKARESAPHPRGRLTYRFCRWGSTVRARTRGPHTPSGDTQTRCTVPPRWPRSGTSRTGTPGTEAHGQGASPVSIMPVASPFPRAGSRPPCCRIAAKTFPARRSLERGRGAAAGPWQGPQARRCAGGHGVPLPSPLRAQGCFVVALPLSCLRKGFSFFQY